MVAVINAADSAFKESGGSASVGVDATKITISNPNGFNLKGSGNAIGLSQSMSGAGYIEETITLKDKNGSDVQFGQVTLEFSGAPENGDVISIILVLDGNTTTISHTVTDSSSLSSIATDLKNKINAINTFTASVSGTSITIAKTGFGATDINVGNGVGLDSGFTISYQAKGKDNAPTVDFKNAVLVESSLTATEVTTYSVELVGEVREGEEWALTLGGNAYTYVVESGVTTLSALAEKIKDKMNQHIL